jgi:hypothetical protein
MWTALFGAGWIWGALVGAALACFLVGVLGFVFFITTKPPRLWRNDLGED